MLSLWDLDIAYTRLFYIVKMQIRITKWDLYRQMQC